MQELEEGGGCRWDWGERGRSLWCCCPQKGDSPALRPFSALVCLSWVWVSGSGMGGVKPSGISDLGSCFCVKCPFWGKTWSLSEVELCRDSEKPGVWSGQQQGGGSWAASAVQLPHQLKKTLSWAWNLHKCIILRKWLTGTLFYWNTTEKKKYFPLSALFPVFSPKPAFYLEQSSAT